MVSRCSAVPGLSGGAPNADAASLEGFAVVHLHGGLTAAPYDGWAENIFAPGQHAVSDYSMDQRAALLWYHDHVMGVTRFTVYAGLAVLWIVRDDRERALDLPEGPPFEIPLLLQDRNFGEDPQGRLTGELVHKTDPGTMEAFAPFTTVNGKVWPLLNVQPSTYRVRVINGSNARTFRLVLVGDGQPELGRVLRVRQRRAVGHVQAPSTPREPPRFWHVWVSSKGWLLTSTPIDRHRCPWADAGREPVDARGGEANTAV
jgi:Multicopper oxidase